MTTLVRAPAEPALAVPDPLGETLAMTGHVAAIFRHPVKGFTPEPLTTVTLSPGAGVPGDRIFTVENGPSGFDPAEPKFTPKSRFTVLAHIPKVAAVRTRYDDGVLNAEAPGQPPFSADLRDEPGREAFAAWLTEALGEDANGPLKVLPAPGAWRFFDHPKGHVSIINLASVRDLEARLGRPVDPLRFRANLYVEGWPAWAENDWAGRELMVGWVKAEVFAPITRCAATHVDPQTAERDLEVTKALFDNYGHMLCGIYVHVKTAGPLTVGDAATAPETPA